MSVTGQAYEELFGDLQDARAQVQKLIAQRDEALEKLEGALDGWNNCTELLCDAELRVRDLESVMSPPIQDVVERWLKIRDQRDEALELVEKLSEVALAAVDCLRERHPLRYMPAMERLTRAVEEARAAGLITEEP